MSQVVIENPVINSPSAKPNQHFQFNDEGITNQIAEGLNLFNVGAFAARNLTRPED
jgi:hypothetical protein